MALSGRCSGRGSAAISRGRIFPDRFSPCRYVYVPPRLRPTKRGYWVRFAITGKARISAARRRYPASKLPARYSDRARYQSETCRRDGAP